MSNTIAKKDLRLIIIVVGTKSRPIPSINSKILKMSQNKFYKQILIQNKFFTKCDNHNSLFFKYKIYSMKLAPPQIYLKQIKPLRTGSP